MLQEGSTEDSNAAAVVLEFNYPDKGVTILATSTDDLIVHTNYD
jgi:hypothetical protein